MHQPTFASGVRAGADPPELFLERIDGLVPWEELEARIEPHYPKAGRGRRPLAVMLRSHWALLQPQRPRHGGPPLRGRVGAASAVSPWHSRREHHPPLPQSATTWGRSCSGPPRPPPCACARARSWTPASSGALLDEEPPARARPGNAPDEEGERVAFRHEAAHRVDGAQHGTSALPEAHRLLARRGAMTRATGEAPGAGSVVAGGHAARPEAAA